MKAPNEIVSSTESDSSIRDEVNRRTYKAGYTDRDGQPRSAGKGDVPRPVSRKFQENYVKLFGEFKLNTWPRDEAGNLID